MYHVSMKSKIKKYLSLFLLSALVLTGSSCTKGGDPAAQRAYQPITLEYWTVFNSPEDYSQIIADYQAIHPNIRVNVKKFRFDEYENQLVNALAEDRGPDIYSLHNTWVPSYRTKLLPLPPTTTLAYQFTTGTIQKETITELRTTRSLNDADLKRDYLEQVFDDVYLPRTVIEDGEIVLGAPAIYALPVAFDTMVMYFNPDLLDNAGIPQPAEFWHEFQEDVQQLARFDSFGNVISAGTALGTANNIPRSVDLLSVLMMQNGAEMIDEEGRDVVFNEIPQALRGTRSTVPGEEATRFYTSFANENNRNYTWTANEQDALEAFIQGKVAYFFGYFYHKEQIEGLAPKLNFEVAPFPQIQGNPEIYFANYWVEGVSKRTVNADAAWDFVQFMTSSAESEKFLVQTQKPTARRQFINNQIADPELSVYANQLLKSKSWYNGQDPAAMETIMRTLITDTLSGVADIDDLVSLAADRVQQTLRF